MHKMSASQLALFYDCSLQWKFKYFDQKDPDERFEYMNTIFGTAFHYVLERLFSNEIDEFKINNPLEDIIEYGKELFRNEFTRIYDEYKAEGVTIRSSERVAFKSELNDLTYRFQINLNKLLKSEFYKDYEYILAEEEMSVSIRDYIIRGTVDFIGVNHDGSYDIMDFKTGYFFQEKPIKEDYQTLFYTFMCYDKFGRFPDSFKYLLSNRKNMSFRIHEIEGFDMESITYFYNNIDKFHDKVEKGEFEKRDPTQNDILCKFCQYRASCFKTKL